MLELSKGAEAIIYKSGNKIIKERIKKSYRIHELDVKLRKYRTKIEAKLLNEARRVGVNTPRILEIKDFSIVMEFINGKKVKDILNKISPEEREAISFEIGKNIGKLHAYGIVHGDLTTSNMILSKGKVFFIDFGLGFFSKRIEDLATDLSVLKESLKATHYKYLNEIWNKIIEGYKISNPQWKEVLAHLKKVETRGRYIKRN
ncbi:MAG TPA: Kae1-associated serine/threonine protein kinase [Nanoarchaeota archaeon]|nr:Kae1-associated serine/threonine protein kinase [Nanoarchaeota archaeon]